jgi:hypothetical protein
LVGKLVGISITGIIVCALIAVGFVVEFKMACGTEIALSVIQSHILIIAMILPMASIAVLFSVFLPEMFTPIATAVVIYLAFSTPLLSNIPIVYGGIIPDFELFNFKSFAVYGTSIEWGYIFLTIIYGIIFSTFATSIASLVFSSKDIK